MTRLVEIWQAGHKLVVSSLESATQAQMPPYATFQNLDEISLELRKQLRLIESEVPGFDAENWYPWRASANLRVRCGWDLESACNLFVKQNCTPEWQAIDEWTEECGQFVLNLDKLAAPPLTENEVTILDEMLTMQAIANSPCSAKSILTSLNWTIEGKHAFDTLKTIGYVASKKGPGGGYYLTSAGIDRAHSLK